LSFSERVSAARRRLRRTFFYHPLPNVEVVWKAGTNWPKSLRVFKATPRSFPAAMVSNAMALAAFGKQDMVVSNQSVIRFQDGKADRWTRALDILPANGQISYRVRTGLTGPAENVPSEEEVAKRAWEYSARLGFDRSQLIEKPEKRQNQTCEGSAEVCARGTFLTRLVDDCEINGMGFGLDLGSHGQIRAFYLLWPNLDDSASSPSATPEQVIAWLKQGRALPTVEELQDPATLKKLAGASKLTISKVILGYGEGRYGELPLGNAPQPISPFVILECTAEVGGDNIKCKFYCPILSATRDKP
jgi:hypothetical protein